MAAVVGTMRGIFGRFEKLVPAPLINVARTGGGLRMFAMLLRIGVSYQRTFFYLLRKNGLRAAWNFIITKLFVPTGEGAGGVAYFVFGPIVRRYPNQLIRMPRQFEVEVTTVCDKKCIHCENTHWKPGEQPRRHLAFEDFRNLVDQFPKLSWIGLVGEGSALLNKDFVKMIEYMKEKDVFVSFPDHFSDWPPGFARNMVELGVDCIGLSMDAAQRETYESLKVGCDYDNVIQNMKELVRAKKEMNSPLPEILFHYTVMKPAVEEIPEFVDLVASMGSRRDFGDGSRISFSRILVFEENKHLNVDEIPREIISKAMEKAKEHNLFVGFTGTNVSDERPTPSCCMAWMEPYIMMGGYVLPCCAIFMSNNRPFLREHALGNVFDTPFKEIWDSERYRRFRQTVTREDKPVPLLCKGCRIFNTIPREEKYGVDESL